MILPVSGPFRIINQGEKEYGNYPDYLLFSVCSPLMFITQYKQIHLKCTVGSKVRLLAS